MKTKQTAAVLAAALLALNAVPSQAEPIVKARLSGWDEVPAVSSTGSGLFVARLNADTIDYEVTYDGLEGTAVAAHVHVGQPGATGGVSAFLCGGGGKPACPAAGTVAGTIVAADVVGPAAQGVAAGEIGELLAAIAAGAAYVNVHTTKHPGGEIRGNLAPGR